ncbi:hypothetical protein BDM02DRAFT_1355662 [Thelephora ganbajun]|uniref:Uncharacterized protein n=1 Tax=Thelephora ganbajun TaxID=370292 RepID=A0ACB6Z1Y8_THEGA|nr:hypothetical protein BDM02DRAFT_1355662 [Thelephora ganbajun]
MWPQKCNIRLEHSKIVRTRRRLQAAFDIRPQIFDLRITNIGAPLPKVTTGDCGLHNWFETLPRLSGVDPITLASRVEGGGENPPIVGSTGERAHADLFCVIFDPLCQGGQNCENRDCARSWCAAISLLRPLIWALTREPGTTMTKLENLQLGVFGEQYRQL